VTLSQPDVRTNHPGSLWRCWDPHVHLPGTLRNDGFGALDIGEALDILASRNPAIEVVGVTDYGTTTSFREAQESQRAGAGVSIGLLFPNVELRLAYATNQGAAVNLHLLCAPEQVDELDRFLAQLEFTYQDRGRTERSPPTSYGWGAPSEVIRACTSAPPWRRGRCSSKWNWISCAGSWDSTDGPRRICLLPLREGDMTEPPA
jgi:hypothetical protein